MVEDLIFMGLQGKDLSPNMKSQGIIVQDLLKKIMMGHFTFVVISPMIVVYVLLVTKIKYHFLQWN